MYMHRSVSRLAAVLIIVGGVALLAFAGYGVSCLLPVSSPFALFCHVPEVVPPESYVPSWDSDVQSAPLDVTTTIARVIAEWNVLQGSIAISPTLGATAWRPTDIQFIGKGNLLVRFEDGHISATAVIGTVSTGAFTYIATLQDEPWTDVHWREVVAQYGDPTSLPRTYTTSIARGDSVQTFSGWTEVPENVFVSR